jgi:hemerythrin-like domain-containing protein
MNDLMRTMTFVTKDWASCRNRNDRRALNFPCHDVAVPQAGHERFGAGVIAVTLVIAVFDLLTQDTSGGGIKKMATRTGVLRQEHQSIRAMLDFTEGVAGKMSRGEPASAEVLAKVMDFIRVFVDQCHHSKEEDVFFPMLEKKGIHTFGGPLGVMLMEHDRARSLIQEMSETGEVYNADGQGSGEQWARTAWDYSDLMYDHFGKEEEVLFRMADNVLSPEEQAAVAGAFELLEKEKIGPGRREQLQAVMADLISHNGRG